MNEQEDDFVRISQRIGSEIPLWTQGTGGNVSLKKHDGTQSRFRIKASGRRLDQVSQEQGHLTLDLTATLLGLAEIETRSAVDDPERLYLELIKDLSRASASGQRASMEAGFHARSPKRWVMHFHSLAAILMADDFFAGAFEFAEDFKASKLGDVHFVDHCLPGWDLCAKSKQFERFSAVILRNHGVILQAEAPNILDVWAELERRYLSRYGFDDLERLGRTGPMAPAPFRVYFPDTAVFVDRIRKVILPNGTLASGEPQYVLTAQAFEMDRAAAELWVASAALYAARPGLVQVPEKMTTTIGDLPIERWRKKC